MAYASNGIYLQGKKEVDFIGKISSGVKKAWKKDFDRKLDELYKILDSLIEEKYKIIGKLIKMRTYDTYASISDGALSFPFLRDLSVLIEDLYLKPEKLYRHLYSFDVRIEYTKSISHYSSGNNFFRNKMLTALQNELDLTHNPTIINELRDQKRSYQIIDREIKKYSINNWDENIRKPIELILTGLICVGPNKLECVACHKSGEDFQYGDDPLRVHDPTCLKRDAKIIKNILFNNGLSI